MFMEDFISPKVLILQVFPERSSVELKTLIFEAPLFPHTVILQFDKVAGIWMFSI